MERISIFWWIDGPQYWQKKWDFERQSQHRVRSKWGIFRHLMLPILAKCILWISVFACFWEYHKKNWGFQQSYCGPRQDIASFQPVSVSTGESIPMSSHALLLLEILLNLSFFLFRNNFCKDWLKVPVLTKLAWPFNFTEWRPVDYLCLEGFAKSFCPTLNKLVTQPTFTSNIFPITVSSGSQANIPQLIGKPGERIIWY